MATHARILTHLFTKYPGKTGSASQATTRRPNIRSRHYSDVAQQPGTLDSSDNVSVDVPGVQHGWLFIDSVFPVRLGSWDLRHYIGIFREETLLTRLSNILSSVKIHDFQVVSLEPHQKDGGVFVQFTYNTGEPASALKSLQKTLREEAGKRGGMPSWIGMAKGDAWLVKGTPWKEDMHRFATPIVKLAFEGPEIHEEVLYDLFRPYGQIQDLTTPTPVPAGSLRSTTITFRRLRSATIARNVAHGFVVGTTRIRTSYQQPVRAHAIRDWLSSHPKIVLPVLAFLLGTLTYTIFDPIRSLMVEGKMLNWFDFRQYTIYKWLRANTLDRFDFSGQSQSVSPIEDVWKERKDAEMAVRNYLSDIPNTVAFVHGPQGSGKTQMMNSVLKDTERKALIIDCGKLHKATSDSALVAGLAQQTGYWPVFAFLDSVNNLFDLASISLIGQKVGLSNSLTDQLGGILEVVGTGLTRVGSSHRKATEHKLKQMQLEENRIAAEISRHARVRNGTWHDGRLDCIAGNGIISELGFGDEPMYEADMESQVHEEEGDEMTREKEMLIRQQERERKERSVQYAQAISDLPIVIIRNYATKGGTNREELLDVLATWAASLVENQVAHVIVVSDNRENSKRLAKALPSKPLNSIALYDADAASALSFVAKKLRDAGIDKSLTLEETSYVERLGGRSSDLDSLMHKVRSGQGVKEAVEDIIDQGVAELRKNAFGDDAEDAKSFDWTREQAWIVLKRLSKQTEIPYHDLLVEFPFKGNESPLRSMEHAELISISTQNGRPSIIRPGKPVFKYVFEQLVNDPIFQATQDIAFNDQLIAASESKIRACEEELTTLKNIGTADSSWWGGKRASSERTAYLFSKMLEAERKIKKLDKQTTELKKILAKGG